MKHQRSLLLVLVCVFVMAFSLNVAAAEFSDVDGHWAKDAILRMADAGIVSGYNDGTFRPDGQVTRAEFATMLHNAVGAKRADKVSKKLPFTDVKADWYYDAVVTLYNDGVIQGTSATTFSPTTTLNREQMVTLIARANKIYNCFDLTFDRAKTLADFSDADSVSDFAKEGCAYAYQAGLINGINGAFAPKGIASRAQVVTILDRSLFAQKDLPVTIAQKDWVDAKQYVELSTGIRMAYVEMGKADGKPLVLLHGHTDSSRTWSMTAQELAKDFHLYILDQRGSGDTDAPDSRAYPSTLFANDVSAFMEAVGVEKAHVVGHSMGSAVAQAFAILYPEKVDRLILMGSMYVTDAESYKYAAASYAADDFDPTDPTFLDYWDYVTPGCWDGAAYKADAEEMLKYIKEDTAKIDRRAFINPPTGSMLSSLVNGYDRITAPTLVMCGESDAPRQYDLIDALGDNYRGILVYPGHNHSIQWEIPYEIGQDIAKYLKGEANEKIVQKYQKELPKNIAQKDWVDAKQYVQLSTGITMAYVEMGNPEGENLVLVHGTTDSSRANSVLANYICKFSDDYHVYIVDQRGSGNTDAPKQAFYTCSTFVEDLNSFFDTVGIEKTDLAGHSLGSRVVTLFAATYPDKVDKLILMGTSPTTPEAQYGAGGDARLEFQSSPAFEEQRKTAEWLDNWDYVTPNILEGKEYKEEVEEMMTFIKEETANIAIEAYTSTMRARAIEDFTKFYPKVTAPTLFLHGETDGPAVNAKYVMDRVPNSKGIIVYPGVSHSIEWERPAEVAKDILDFCNDVPVSYQQGFTKELPLEISQEDWNDSKQFLPLSTGITMAYVEMGDPDGEPVILVHGGGGDTSRTFSLMAPFLAKAGFHVFSVDRKANGDTVGPAVANYDYYSEATDLAAFIDALGYEKANIVGHSMGGIVCQCFLVLYPEKIDKIAFYPSMLWKASEFTPMTEADLDDAYYNDWIYNEIPEAERSDDYKKFLEWEIFDAKRITVDDLNRMHQGSANTDTTQSFKNIDTEFLFIWSTLDYTPRPELVKILQAGNNVNFLVYDGVGHNIQWEIPEKLANDLIAYFNDETPPSGYVDQEAFIASDGEVIQPLE